jgi:prevent-host-death family protein
VLSGILFIMRRAGVREARKNLRALLGYVKKGKEVVITEHGRAIARLAPLDLPQRFPDLSRTRRLVKRRDVALSQAVIEDRNDRL